jgi:hypothetical protein
MRCPDGSATIEDPSVKMWNTMTRRPFELDRRLERRRVGGLVGPRRRELRMEENGTGKLETAEPVAHPLGRFLTVRPMSDKDSGWADMGGALPL